MFNVFKGFLGQGLFSPGSGVLRMFFTYDIVCLKRGVAMLYNKLKEYSAGGVYPMHMPGHKRNPGLLPPGLPYDIDITEIHGFDDLHNAEGVLLETAELAAALYGSMAAFPLINGSTAGILAAIGALAARGDKILIARNNHWSVDNAASLFGLSPVYIAPGTDEASGVAMSIDPDAVKAALDEDPAIKLAVVTSPSYEGVVSDISAIAGAAHDRGVPLLVDSAHGAHLGFSPGFPASAVKSGADVVVMSLHKTLPALTQCSLLHACGGQADSGEIKRLLSVLQTSSPSYVLMASIDNCLRLLASEKDRLFEEYERNLKDFYKSAAQLKNLSILGNKKEPQAGFFAQDTGKIVIITKNTTLSGHELADILRKEHKIELERTYAHYAIAMTSICDNKEGFDRLSKALAEIDNAL